MTLEAQIQLTLGLLDLDVQLEAADDEVVAILGPNGAGKTTILRALAGLQPIDAGRITLDGVVLDEPSERTLVVPERRPIGVVFQDYLLFPFLSARDNVAFGLRSRGVRKAEARRRADVWLERVGLLQHGEAKPGALSGGQAQRVALARALVTEPRMLLLDEPLAALDAGAKQDIRRELRRDLAGFDGVRIIVTHDPVDAATLADRMIVVEGGRVTQHGDFAEVSAHPRTTYVANLVGLNLYRGRARVGTVELEGGSDVAVTDADVEGLVFVAFRPQAVALHVSEPAGSPRNRWSGTVTEIEPLADRVRVHVEGDLSVVADVTRTASDELHLGPGARVWASVKATEIDVYSA